MTMTLNGSGTGTVGVPNVGTAQNATGTAITFTGIPSGTKRITVMFNGVSTNGSSIIQLQIGSGSLTATGYLGSGCITLTGVVSAVSNNSSGFLTSGDGASSYVRYGSCVLTNISGNIWTITGILGQSDAARIQSCGGSVTISGTLDRVGITTVNGTDTFDAGSFNILYE